MHGPCCIVPIKQFIIHRTRIYNIHIIINTPIPNPSYVPIPSYITISNYKKGRRKGARELLWCYHLYGSHRIMYCSSHPLFISSVTNIPIHYYWFLRTYLPQSYITLNKNKRRRRRMTKSVIICCTVLMVRPYSIWVTEGG